MDTEITAVQAAQILGVSPRHVRWYHKEKKLPARKIGKRLLLFKLKDVEQFQKPKTSGRPKANRKEKKTVALKKRRGKPKGTSNEK